MNKGKWKKKLGDWNKKTADNREEMEKENRIHALYIYIYIYLLICFICLFMFILYSNKDDQRMKKEERT